MQMAEPQPQPKRRNCNKQEKERTHHNHPRFSCGLRRPPRITHDFLMASEDSPESSTVFMQLTNTLIYFIVSHQYAHQPVLNILSSTSFQTVQNTINIGSNTRYHIPWTLPIGLTISKMLFSLTFLSISMGVTQFKSI